MCSSDRRRATRERVGLVDHRWHRLYVLAARRGVLDELREER
jgi:hypothetical protein